MTILVTGANKGIGFEICRQLAKAGHHVILSARSAERGENAVKALAQEGLKAEFLLLDMGDEASIQRAARELKQRHQALHALINNAAILNDWQGSVLNTTAADLRETLNINTVGPIILTLALLPLLEAGKPARVINVSSQLGSVQNMTDGWASYGISKAALNAATRKLAQALKGRGISVNAASPGWVRTEMGTDAAPLTVEHGAQNIIRIITDMPATLTDHYLEEHGQIPW
ncbi:MAG TPA: SDR family NAD(P)-dependent oxidoreductase [Candidatus Methylacidiphilales bacterium]|jgi:NAD(P)-dependent dehydrogenase (short-subunit alcohol dehydrogenase family)|nr:SDR family NAD(P)-dependent oxidoreductase [Candidatus Methylacidiphilales bacterium]